MTMRLRLVLAAAVLGLALPASAHAEDGAWKVGSSYVIRFEKLDLSSAIDRQILLAQVERAAGKLCTGERTRGRKQACTAKAVEASLAATPELRSTIQIARLERDRVQQAQR
jgi:UrcA family protein